MTFALQPEDSTKHLLVRLRKQVAAFSFEINQAQSYEILLPELLRINERELFKRLPSGERETRNPGFTHRETDGYRFYSRWQCFRCSQSSMRRARNLGTPKYWASCFACFDLVWKPDKRQRYHQRIGGSIEMMPLATRNVKSGGHKFSPAVNCGKPFTVTMATAPRYAGTRQVV